MGVEGPATKAVFETYLEHVLASTLRGGQVMVMDNLLAHKGVESRRSLKALVPSGSSA
jgi:transposase